MSPDYVVVAGFFQTKISKTILSSSERKKQINGYGNEALQAILAKPTVENFLDSCWVFAQKAGFVTDGVRQLAQSAKAAGAVGAAQNMIGHAVHAVVPRKDAGAVAEAFKRTLPKEQVIISGIDFQGARLVK
jgi:pantoate kinase